MKVCLLVLVLGCVDLSLQTEAERKLIKELMAQNDKRERPVANHTNTLQVQFGLLITNIFEVNSAHGILVCDVWANMAWESYLFKWNPDDHGGLTRLTLSSEEIWTPDIVPVNTVYDKAPNWLPTPVLVHSTGKSFWTPPGQVRTICAFNMIWFPFDEHVCRIHVASWTHNILELNITPIGEAFSAMDSPSSEWTLINTSVLSFQNTVSLTSQLVFSVHIERKALYFVYTLIIPCVVLSSLTLLMFLLPQDSGERVSLGKRKLQVFPI